MDSRTVDNQLALDIPLEYLFDILIDRGVISQADEDDVRLCNGFVD